MAKPSESAAELPVVAPVLDRAVVQEIATEVRATGRLSKVLYFDEHGERLGGAQASTALPEDPFQGRMDRAGLQAPPFSLEQLVLLAEQHPVHSAALEQKASDIVGQGWTWLADDPDMVNSQEATDLRDEIDDWLNGLASGEQTLHELLRMVEDDYLCVGQGFLEVARDALGNVAQLYHVPAHTVRFQRDGIRLAQIRGQKIVWFKRWGSPKEDADGQEISVNRTTGGIGTSVPADKVANELLVIQRPSRRSSWYGIPGYISSIGWISLSLSARDDNLMFFNNRREPRWAVILTNLEDSPDLENDLKNAFKVDLKQPHRNLMIPITGNGKVEFKQLSSDRMDGSYEKLSDRADAAILVGHRVPPERLGLTKVGSLGGSVGIDSSRIYKEAVIQPDQALLSARINRFIDVEYPGDRSLPAPDLKPVKHPVDLDRPVAPTVVVQAPPAPAPAPKPAAPVAKAGAGNSDPDLPWTWYPVELDLAEEAEDLKNMVMAFKANIITIDEARVGSGRDPLNAEKFPDYGSKFWFDVASKAGGQGDTGGGAPGGLPGGADGGIGNGEDPVETDPEVTKTLSRVDAAIAELMAARDDD